MGLWHLSLRALTKGDAEKVKSYAKELNNGEYNFHPFDERTLTGLEYIDMGIMYSHVTPDCLKNFHKFSEEIAAHFSEVKLICEEFDSDTQQLFTYWPNICCFDYLSGAWANLEAPVRCGYGGQYER